MHDRERPLDVRCSGCGSSIGVVWASGTPEEDQEVLERVQACPPFCVVCSCRTVAGTRPPVELWEGTYPRIERRRQDDSVATKVSDGSTGQQAVTGDALSVASGVDASEVPNGSAVSITAETPRLQASGGGVDLHDEVRY